MERESLENRIVGNVPFPEVRAAVQRLGLAWPDAANTTRVSCEAVMLEISNISSLCMALCVDILPHVAYECIEYLRLHVYVRFLSSNVLRWLCYALIPLCPARMIVCRCERK